MTKKFKLDENLGRRVQQIFQDRRFDADTVRDEKLQGAKDPRVLQAATAEDRILVTMDQDFANVLIFPPEETAGIAVIRPPGRATPALLEKLISGLLDAIEKKLIKGRLWIVEPGRIREHQADPRLDEDENVE
jgi:predicted nuclease of predicted toxin-antitoxin system